MKIAALLLALTLPAVAQPRIALPPPPPPRTQDVYLIVTAQTNLGTITAPNFWESFPTVEFRFTVTNNKAITVSWDPDHTMTSYVVRWQTNVSGLTNGWPFTTNGWTPVTFFIVPPPPPVTNYRYYYAQSSLSVTGNFQDLTSTPFLRQTNAGPFVEEVYRLRVATQTNALP